MSAAGYKLAINSILTLKHKYINIQLFDKMDLSVLQQHLAPLLSRIDTLERHNQELTHRVRYLQSVVSPERNYQKLTVSASNHLRDSRLTSKQSEINKKPGWNSKTKIEQSPSKHMHEGSHEKVKTKPPIPKIVKSPGKVERSLSRGKQGEEKKIIGGTKIPTADNSQSKSISQKAPIVQAPQCPRVHKPNNFEELVKHNTQIISSMKHPQPMNAPNLVTKANSPRSQTQNSHTTSPNNRSFISQAIVQ